MYKTHNNSFKYIGIDKFDLDKKENNEFIPSIHFKNPLKQFYYRYIVKENPYSLKSVKNLLKKFDKKCFIFKGDSKIVLPKIDLNEIDYVFLDGGHSYDTVKSDLNNCKVVVENNGIVLCDDYDLSYAPGVKKAIDEFVIKEQYDIKILFNRFAKISQK